jgi:hypothetical protein
MCKSVRPEHAVSSKCFCAGEVAVTVAAPGVAAAATPNKGISKARGTRACKFDCGPAR